MPDGKSTHVPRQAVRSCSWRNLGDSNSCGINQRLTSPATAATRRGDWNGGVMSLFAAAGLVSSSSSHLLYAAVCQQHNIRTVGGSHANQNRLWVGLVANSKRD